MKSRKRICVGRLALRLVLLLLLNISCLTWSTGQESSPTQYPRNEVFGGHLIAGQAGYSDFDFGHGVSLDGFDFGSKHSVEASFIRNINHFLGLKGDFSVQPSHDDLPIKACASSPCSPASETAAFNRKLFNFLGGPEFDLRNHTRFTPYGHSLFGIAHTTAALSSSGSAASFSLHTGKTGFSMAFGGGLDVRMARRFSFRTGVDFNSAWAGQDDGARTAIKNMRFGNGILFNWGRLD
jgi:hypothetical protein